MAIASRVYGYHSKGLIFTWIMRNLSDVHHKFYDEPLRLLIFNLDGKIIEENEPVR
jgi:hypothetical protein